MPTLDDSPHAPPEGRASFLLDGLHLVVSGGHRGIGRGIAPAAARDGELLRDQEAWRRIIARVPAGLLAV